MDKNEQKIIFKKRIKTIKEYVDMFGDDAEAIELYIYDFIAFVLVYSNKEKEKQNLKYIELFINLFKRSKNNIVSLSGKELKQLCVFTVKYGLPLELENILTSLYNLNERKKIIGFKKKYKYYDSIKEYKKLKTIEEELIYKTNIEFNNLNIIYEKYKNNTLYDYDYDEKNNNFKIK